MKHCVRLLMICLVALLAACGQEDAATAIPTTAATAASVDAPTQETTPDESAAQATETTESLTVVASSSAPTVAFTPEPTEEILPTATAAEDTEGAASTAEVDRPDVSPEGYRLIVVTVEPEFQLENAAPAAGERWVLVRLTLGNDGGSEINVAEDTIVAFDAEGNRYIAANPEGNTFPEIYGATIGTDAPVTGFVMFTTPAEAVLTRITWCPVADCETPLSVEI